ncbi:hypothetical protein PO413_15375, partial [Escherichia coli]
MFHSRAASLVIREHVQTAMVRRHQEQGSVIYASILPQKPFIYKGHCELSDAKLGNDSNLLIVFYVQIMPDDFVMQLHR